MVYTQTPGGGYAADRMPLTLQSLRAPALPQSAKKGPVLLQEELQAAGVDYTKPQKSQLGFEARLPLSWFDDADFETKQPHEWVACCRKANRRADGFALVLDDSGRGTWRYMKVHKFSTDAGKYLVSSMDAMGSMLGKPYLEDRVNLCFLDERQSQFANRVASAHKRRDLAEEDLLRRHYIQNMPVGELRQISAFQVNRILELAYSTEQLRQGALDPTSLVEETRLEYARTLNTLLFESELRQPGFRDQVRFPTLELPRKPPVAELGVIPAWLPSAYDYSACAKSFGGISSKALPEAVQAMAQVQYECLQLMKLSLFTIEFSASIRLEDFEQLQMQHIMRFVQFIRDSWQPTLKKGVLSAIVHASPEWRQEAPRPSVYEQDEIPEIRAAAHASENDHGSRPKRMTRAINLMVADTLRNVANASLEAYADYFCSRATERSYVEDPESLFAEKAPLFVLDMVWHADDLFYSTSADFFASVPIRLVDEALNALKGLQALDPFDRSFGRGSEELGEVPSVDSDELQVIACKEKMAEALKASTVPLTEFIADFARHLPHIQLDVHTYIKEFAAVDKPEEERPSLKQMQDKVLEHIATKESLEAEVPQLVMLGMYLVSVVQVRQAMLNKHAQVIELTLELIDGRARAASQQLARKFADMHAALQEQPRDIERLTEMRMYMTETLKEVDSMQTPVDAMMAHYDAMEEFRHDPSREDITSRWAVFHWPTRIAAKVDECAKLMEEDRATFFSMMVNDQKAFDRTLDELKLKVANFGQHAEFGKVEQIYAQVGVVEAAIAEARAKAGTFATREELFEVEEHTDYELIDKLEKDFEPFASLWTNAHNWSKWHSSWMDGPLADLDPAYVSKSFEEAQAAMVRAVKSFREQPGCLAIASQIKEEMETFVPFVPLVKALRDRGMRARHWDTLSSELGFDLHPNSTFTLRDATDGLQLHQLKTLEVVERVCEHARQEYAIEKSLDEMQAAWAELDFEVMPYRTTGTGVMRMSDEAKAQLDYHIGLTQQFSFSPYKGAFEERIKAWERQLRNVQDVTTVWLVCQRNWMYLQPIFDTANTEDINRLLPAESKRFTGVDRNWRKTIDRVGAAPNIVTFCDDDELLRLFSKSNEDLERVQKNLKEYEETKRAGFVQHSAAAPGAEDNQESH